MTLTHSKLLILDSLQKPILSGISIPNVALQDTLRLKYLISRMITLPMVQYVTYLAAVLYSIDCKLLIQFIINIRVTREPVFKKQVFIENSKCKINFSFLNSLQSPFTSLIKEMLCKNPVHRINAADCLKKL